MSKITIERAGHQVTVEDSTVNARDLVPIAQTIWLSTYREADSPGPAFGFSHERRWSPHIPPPGLLAD